MGYTSSQAQLMTMPPYVAGAISALTMSYFSDKSGWRMPFVVGPMCIITLGFCILTPLAPTITKQIPACYIGVMLICIGQYPTNPAGSAWIGGNLAGDMKRSMGVSLFPQSAQVFDVLTYHSLLQTLQLEILGVSWAVISSLTLKSQDILLVLVLVWLSQHLPYCRRCSLSIHTPASTRNGMLFQRRRFERNTPMMNLCCWETSHHCSDTSYKLVNTEWAVVWPGHKHS